MKSNIFTAQETLNGEIIVDNFAGSGGARLRFLINDTENGIRPRKWAVSTKGGKHDQA